MIIRTLSIAAILAAAALATGCAGPGKSGSDYTDAESRRPMQVSYGTIESVRQVRLERNRQTGVGQGAGAVIGGVAGSNVGGGKGAIVGTVAGAVLGGVVGGHIEKSTSDRPALEITVKADDGRTLATVQETGNDSFAIGQRVRLLWDARGQMRVTP